MPAVIALLVNMLRVMLMAKAGLFVAKVLGFFGLTFLTNEYAIEPLLAQIQGMMTGSAGGGDLGAALIAWAGVLRFDEAVSMVLSAYSTAMTIRGGKMVLGIAGSAP